jgi:hypothetical protein
MGKNSLQCLTCEEGSSKIYVSLETYDKKIDGSLDKDHFIKPGVLEVTVIGEDNGKALVILPPGFEIDQIWVEVEKLRA